MPSPARTMPLAGLPVPGHDLPDQGRGARAHERAGQRVHRLTRRLARKHAARASRLVLRRRRGAIVALEEEVRGLAVGVVLRHLVREPQAVVERQLAVHLPVVLHVGLELVVDELPFDERGLLRVRGEHAERRVGEAEPGIERVVGVVGEAQVALERQRVALVQVLLLQAVVAVEADLRRCASRGSSSG